MSELYKLTGEYIDAYNAVIDSVDEETGEVDTALVERLNSIQEFFEEKAIKVAYVYCKLDGEIEQTDKLLKRLLERKKRLVKAKENVKEYLSASMQNAGVESIKGDYANISFRPSEQTVIDDITQLEDEFFIVKKEPNKTAIKQAIKNGREISGAHIEKKKNIIIK